MLPSGETIRRSRKSFIGARTCSRSSITVPSLVGLEFQPPLGWPKTLSFLSVMLLNVRGCAPDFAMKALEYRNNCDAVGYGKVCSCAPCPTFSDCCQLATPLNAKVQKPQKWGFSPTEFDQINQRRRNLACKRILTQ